jgi:hypothetical protein
MSRLRFSSHLTAAAGLVGLLGASLSGCGGGGSTPITTNPTLPTPGTTPFVNSRQATAAACTANPHQSGRARWTVLVYMNAANNLQPDSLFNVAQMASVGSDGTNLNIVIQWKQSAVCNYFSSVNSCGQTSFVGTHRYYLLQHSQADVNAISNGNTASLEDSSERLPDPTTNTLHDNPNDATTPLTSDMGAYQTLQNFVQWGATHYPADHLAVVVWDHGSGALSVVNRAVKGALSNQKGVSSRVVPGSALGGLLNGAAQNRLTSGAAGRFVPLPGKLKVTTRGLSEDCNTGNQIDTTQLPLGLASPPQPVDMLIIDCSLQCTTEVAYQVRSAARVMVGSEESPPGTGYPYDVWLNDVKVNGSQGQGPCAVGADLINQDLAVYAAGGSENAYQNNNVTQAMIDLSEMSNVATAVNVLGNNLVTTFNTAGSLIAAARANAHQFEFPEFKDLYHFANLIQASSGVPSTLATAAYNVQYAMTNTTSGAVLMSAHGASGEAQASGLSIYLPDPGVASSVDYTTGYDPAYNNLALATAAPGWVSFLQAEAPSQ